MNGGIQLGIPSSAGSLRRTGEIGEVLDQLPSLIVPESEADEDVSST